MSFLSLVLALLAERFTTLGSGWRRFVWFDSLRAGLASVVGERDWFRAWPGLLLVLFLPAIALELVLGAMSGWLLSIPALLLASAVLLSCLGPERLERTLAAYLRDFEEGNAEGAYRHVAEQVAPEGAYDSRLLARAVSAWILCAAPRRWFAVLFWFVLLGPSGALLYRLMLHYAASLKPGHSHGEPLSYLIALTEWLPARLTALAYALSGDFERGFVALQRHGLSGLGSNPVLLVEAGEGALGLKEAEEAGPAENRAALALIERARVVVVVMASVLALLGLLW